MVPKREKKTRMEWLPKEGKNSTSAIQEKESQHEKGVYTATSQKKEGGIDDRRVSSPHWRRNPVEKGCDRDLYCLAKRGGANIGKDPWLGGRGCFGLGKKRGRNGGKGETISQTPHPQPTKNGWFEINYWEEGGDSSRKGRGPRWIFGWGKKSVKRSSGAPPQTKRVGERGAGSPFFRRGGKLKAQQTSPKKEKKFCGRGGETARRGKRRPE